MWRFSWFSPLGRLDHHSEGWYKYLTRLLMGSPCLGLLGFRTSPHGSCHTHTNTHTTGSMTWQQPQRPHTTNEHMSELIYWPNTLISRTYGRTQRGRSRLPIWLRPHWLHLSHTHTLTFTQDRWNTRTCTGPSREAYHERNEPERDTVTTQDLLICTHMSVTTRWAILMNEAWK